MGTLKGAQEVVGYDPVKDIAFYKTTGTFYEADTTNYFVFFPGLDAHQPGVKVEGVSGVKVDGVSGVKIEGRAGVKKLVIKVRTDD